MRLRKLAVGGGAIFSLSLALSGVAHAPDLPAVPHPITVDERLEEGANAWNLHRGAKVLVVGSDPEIPVTFIQECAEMARSCAWEGKIYLAPGEYYSGPQVQAHELGHAAFGLPDRYVDGGECGRGIMGCTVTFDDND